MGNYAFRKREGYALGVFFSFIPEVIRGFSFMLKVLFPVAIFSNLVVLQSKNDNQTRGASTSAHRHERETEKKTKKDKNSHEDEILSRIADLEKRRKV